MLGRFLEFSVATGDILASYEFYRALGFVGADASEVYPYRYGVVTDGRIALGLHEAEVPQLCLTFVLPDLAVRARDLRDAGIAVAYEHLSEERLNEIGIRDPDGNVLRLIEARTFSPVGSSPATLTGWFEDLVLPVRDLATSLAFWEHLGFVRTDDAAGSASLTSDYLSLSLQTVLKGPRAWLHFTVDDVESCRAGLDAAGLVGQPAPPSLRVDGGISIVAPEGTPLLLVPESR